jgi:hypothetical protein
MNWVRMAIFLLDRDECREKVNDQERGWDWESIGLTRSREDAKGGVPASVSLSNLVSGISGAFVLYSFQIMGLRRFQIGFA